ncbi:acyl-ACP desaturase [Phormidium sp. LEGE 05292]|uniref:acyl-ACP desaturase n=1 Tax=[Phormidium] sp. LEGE 05292 TaxID=767427 RepID=UPI00187FE0E4|nr:acyl-ACP desaturase [Phormidium sp. LEGE 05292]MBE9225042.1 acyl-ACP desaturase [Phormidium sp. LEGE 05292]
MQEFKECTFENTNLDSLKKWDIQELNLTLFNREQVSSDLVDVIKATCLIESRADLYSSYLLSVFSSKNEWHKLIHIWNLEERQHGQALQKWSQLVDPDFNFEELYKKYIETVQYHSETGVSVRGSIANELIARCVIEALASAYYAAIRDRTSEPLLRDICDRLSKDEARHYGMFYKFLKEVQKTEKINIFNKLLILAKRVFELEDDQIIYASFCISTHLKQQNYNKSREGNTYISKMYPLYERKHIYYILNLLLPILELPKHGRSHHLLSFLFYYLIKIRIFLSRLSLMNITGNKIAHTESNN